MKLITVLTIFLPMAAPEALTTVVAYSNVDAVDLQATNNPHLRKLNEVGLSGHGGMDRFDGTKTENVFTSMECNQMNGLGAGNSICKSCLRMFKRKALAGKCKSTRQCKKRYVKKCISKKIHKHREMCEYYNRVDYKYPSCRLPKHYRGMVAAAICDALPVQIIEEEFIVELDVPCAETPTFEESTKNVEVWFEAMRQYFEDEERCDFALPNNKNCGSRNVLEAKVNEVVTLQDTCSINDDLTIGGGGRDLQKKKNRRRVRLRGRRKSSGKCRRKCSARRVKSYDRTRSLLSTSVAIDPTCLADPPNLRQIIKEVVDIDVYEAKVVEVRLLEEAHRRR